MKIPVKAAVFRWMKFNAVGALGTVVQLGMLTLLLPVLTSHFLWATALAVETAVLHNFFWHWRWTWSDRRIVGFDRMVAALVRFNLSNGLISLSGTMLCTEILSGIAGFPPVLANILAFVPCWFINYFVSDRLVFLRPVTGESQ